MSTPVGDDAPDARDWMNLRHELAREESEGEAQRLINLLRSAIEALPATVGTRRSLLWFDEDHGKTEISIHGAPAVVVTTTYSDAVRQLIEELIAERNRL